MHKFDHQLEDDLDWRMAEIASIRAMIANSRNDAIRSDVLFRAGWALLYAHYEGFCKFCLDLFLDCLQRESRSCEELPESIQILALRQEIKILRNAPDLKIYRFLRFDFKSTIESKPKFLPIETESNLTPSRLKQLLDAFDIDSSSLLKEERKLKTLVARRNDIAHGKRVFIEDYSYYKEYDDLTTNVMIEIALLASDQFHSIRRTMRDNP